MFRKAKSKARCLACMAWLAKRVTTAPAGMHANKGEPAGGGLWPVNGPPPETL